MTIRKIGKNLAMIALSTGIAGSGSGCITDDALTDYGLSELTGYMSRDVNDPGASAILGGVSNVQRFSAEYNAQRNIARDGATNVVVNNGGSNISQKLDYMTYTLSNGERRTVRGEYYFQKDDIVFFWVDEGDGTRTLQPTPIGQIEKITK